VARLEDSECWPHLGHDDRQAVGFFAAAGFQWLNPKGWLVAISAAGTYLQATSDAAWFQAISFGAIFFVAALPSGLVWLAMGAALHRLLRDEKSARVFNILMGLALALSVLFTLR
jgi:threonine/homoserine/homoserine lactone efflux protein